MLCTVLGGQEWSGKKPRGAHLLPVSRLLSANAVGFRSCAEAFARCKEYTQGGGSFAAGRARLSLSLTGRFRSSSNGWPDLHSSNGGGSLAAGRARLSLSLPVASVTPLGGLCG